MFAQLRAKLRLDTLMPANPLWRCHAPTALVALFALSLTFALFFVMRNWEEEDNQAQFRYASEHFVEAVHRAMERIELTHEVLRQDFYGSADITQAEFSMCAEPACKLHFVIEAGSGKQKGGDFARPVAERP